MSLDAPLAAMIDLMLQVNAGAYPSRRPTPRHEHEWTLGETIRLAAGKNLIPASSRITR